MRRLVPRVVLASAVSVMLVLFGVVSAGAAVPLSGLASPAAVSWTPQVMAGTTTGSVCQLWFDGSCKDAAVLSTALVNGEVVVAGAFTQVCQAGSGTGDCQAGTTVTRDDIFAYQLGTGVIDPNFAPQLNQGPVNSVVAGPKNTVYVGGAFTTVNGTSKGGIVQLNVNPGVTTGSTADGSIVSAFSAGVTSNSGAAVNAMALDGTALYIGGQFTKVDGTAETGVARVNATTGALDTAFGISISGPVDSTSALQVEGMAVSPNGALLAIVGGFLDVAGQSQPRLALISTGGGLGSAASLDDWQAPIMANPCNKEHDYVRDVDFSPNGAFLDIGTTGYKPSPATSAAVCDAVVRFPATGTGTDIQPTWVDYTGGDSVYSVQDTGPVIYFGGHNRWLNNECGNNDDCEANSVLVMGFSAVDANTGLAIPWFQPLTLRGQGTMSLTAFPAGAYSGSDGGILIGNDTTESGGVYHSFDALFPITSTSTSPTFGSIPSGLFSQGRVGGHDESTAGYAALCVDDPGDNSAAGTVVEAATCDNDAGQNWTVSSGGNIAVSNGLCLDTVGEGTTSGTNVDVNTCSSTAATQDWTQGSGNTLVNSASGLCLSYPGSLTKPTAADLDITSCTGGVNQVWPLPAAPAPASLTPVGPLSSEELQGSASAATQTACLTGHNNNVKMSVCIADPVQEATVEANGNIEFDGLCLDTSGEAITAGTQVVLRPCGSSATQVWSQPGGPGTTVVNSAAGLCLSISSATNGSTADIATCSSTTTGEKWWLPAV
jgi:Ricin-type beta-trefoil lectin domain